MTSKLTDADVRYLHHVDDLCKAHAAIARPADAAVLMLTDALHALRHGSPHITDEFLDRTIINLTRGLAASRAIRDTDCTCTACR